MKLFNSINSERGFRKLYKISLLLFMMSFAAAISRSATVTITVYWTTGWCSICGNQTGNYSCNPPWSGSGQWNNGIRTFADPVPFGNKVTAVSVVVNKVNCGYTNLCVNLNGTLIQCLPPAGGNCGCGTCWPQTYSNSWPCPVGIPNYVYGGTNQIQLVNTGTICVNNAVITLTYEPCCPMTVTMTNVNNVLCNGDCNGSATITQSNGASPFTYLWSSGGTTATETGLCAGTYYATVTDANSCTAIDSVTIVEPPLLTSTTTPTDVLCNGGSDGQATVTASGGTTPYSYTWSSGGNSVTETGLSPGTYTVTVTDNNGCTSVANVTINEPLPITLTPSNTSSNCGQSDGSASVTASGGTSPYSYFWSSGGTNSTELNLSAGTYTVTVTDNNGCTEITTTTIIDIAGGVATASVIQDASCNGGCDGQANVSMNGGTSPFTYNWSSGGTGTTETGLCAGTYTITVTDNVGCSSTSTISITEPTPLVITVNSTTDVACNGGNDGDVTITASGGVSPYAYAWSNGGTSAVETGLSAGTYTVTVTDNNGCTETDTVTISEPTLLVSSIASTTDVLCNGASTGDATVTASGGTPGYTYAWSSGGFGVTESFLPAGPYTVTVTDNNGCTSVSTCTINQPTAISPFINTLDVTCSGSCDGNANLSVVGGITPYTYSWSTGAVSEDITGLCTGMYTVTITDANNCTEIITAPINVGDWSPVADFTPNPKVTDIRNTEISFIDNSTGDVTQWSWTFFSLDSTTVLGGSNEQNPVFIYPSRDQDTGTYCVYLEVQDDAGCLSDTTKCIRIEGIYEIFAPNAFSPNGDGINDYFFPNGVGIVDDEFTFYIYDRWGEIIFQSNRLSEKWDGIAHAKGGNSIAPQDVYIWKIVTKDSVKHLEHEYIGHVTLLR